METGVIELVRPQTAPEIVADLLPDLPYAVDRQPSYPDGEALESAVNQLLGMEGAASIDEIDRLQQDFTDIANGSDEFIIITGRCSQPVEQAPTPERMVLAAEQDAAISAGLLATGVEIPAAKEALLLPSVKALMRVDPTTRKKYYVGAGLPWIGERTRDPEGTHIEALSDIANPVGVKIGKDATPDQIQRYQEKLNPENVDGKLVLMLRIGLDNMDKLPGILDSIKEHTPNAIILYDIHGSTTTDSEGRKIRNVSRIVKEVVLTAQACKDRGLKLHGIHIESTTETHENGSERLECVDFEDQIPVDEGGVDPQTNPRQTEYLVGAVASGLALAA